MAYSFLIGIRDIRDELAAMQSPGCYWINCSRQVDASLFCRQLLSAQPAETQAILVSCGTAPATLLAEISTLAIHRLPLFRLPEKTEAVTQFTQDLMCVCETKQRLIVLHAPATLWQTMSTEELQLWIQQVNRWLDQQQSTLIVLCHGTGIERIKGQLISQHHALGGLAHLQWLDDHAQYQISWWGSTYGMATHQQLILYANPHGWEVRHNTESVQPLFRNDEAILLAEKSIMGNSPVLSENWQLVNSNEELAHQGRHAQAATLIFALHQSDQIETLARQIHTLRRQRGNTLKIAVREMNSSLRSMDERLLLTSGANIVVPHSITLSGFLMMIKGIQGMIFTRLIPDDINHLFVALLPLHQKGYLPPKTFCQSVITLVGDSQLSEHSQGVLIAFESTENINAKKAITLFKPRRFGDIATIINDKLYLFLYSCLITEVDTTLKNIFHSIPDETLNQHQMWYQDHQILSEIKHLHQTAMPMTYKMDSDSDVENDHDDKRENSPWNDKLSDRREPQPLTLVPRHYKE